MDEIFVFLTLNFMSKSENFNIICSLSSKPFYHNTNHPFWVADVVKYIKEKLNEDYPSCFIRRFMKLESNLTYKKIRPRPNSVNINKLKAVRLLFIVEFYKILTPKTLIINVDESSIMVNIIIEFNLKYGWSLLKCVCHIDWKQPCVYSVLEIYSEMDLPHI